MREVHKVASTWYTTAQERFAAPHLATHLLRCCGLDPSPTLKVLILNTTGTQDYLEMSVIAGLKEVLGVRAHDAVRYPWMYSDLKPWYRQAVYGMGHSYFGRIDPDLRRATDTDLTNDL